MFIYVCRYMCSVKPLGQVLYRNNGHLKVGAKGVPNFCKALIHGFVHGLLHSLKLEVAVLSLGSLFLRQTLQRATSTRTSWTSVTSSSIEPSSSSWGCA